MTEEEYKEQRKIWIAKLISIRKPKFFPRCVNARIRGLAKLEADFHNMPYREAYNELYNRFYNL